MAISSQLFQQSIRLMDSINQERIKQGKRILWPDYETLNLLSMFSQESQREGSETSLKNLFMYCEFEENFTVKISSVEGYTQIKELFSEDFTHLALWMCPNRINSKQSAVSSLSSPKCSSQIDSNRPKSIQKSFNKGNPTPKPRQVYVVLSRRSLAIDEIIKTSHKVSISVVPLSEEKFLWGGAINYEQLETMQAENKVDNGLFGGGGDNFGFKIESKPMQASNSIRRNNGFVDKRQLRYSNYHNSQKQPEQPNPSLKQKSTSLQNATVQCSNTIKLLPQHIRQHQQFLYIEIDLNNNPSVPSDLHSFNLMELSLYGRHLKPKYGAKYEQNEESSEEEGGLFGIKNKQMKFAKEEIFLVYTMPFVTFGSYLQSQLNFEQNADLREIKFRGSCQMFSAMKSLKLISQKKQSSSKTKQIQGNQDASDSNSMSQQKPVKQKSQLQPMVPKPCIQKLNEVKRTHKKSYEIKEIQTDQKELDIEREKIKKWEFEQSQSMVLKILESFHKKQNPSFAHSLNSDIKMVYIPVKNPLSNEPFRIAVNANLLQLINQQIFTLTTMVQIQSQQLITIQHEVQIDCPKSRRRTTFYDGKFGKEKQLLKKGQTNQGNKYRIQYLNIDVFLTNKVYTKEVVQTLIDILEVIRETEKVFIGCCENQKEKKFCDTEKEQNTMFKLAQPLVESLSRIITVKITSITQVKQLLTLIEDMESSASFTLLMWFVLFYNLKFYSSHQLNKIDKIKSLLHQAYLYDGQKFDQEDFGSVINTIAKFHDIQSGSAQFNSELFLLFLEEISNKKSYLNQCLKRQMETQKNRIITWMSQICSDFFKFNYKTLLEDYNNQLKQIFTSVQQSLLEKEKQQLQIGTSKTFSHSDTVLYVLKICIAKALASLPQLSMSVFLSQPHQSIDVFQILNSHQNSPFSFKQRLNRFFNKYFLKPHFSFLKGSNAQKKDNQYLKLVTQLLQMHITVANYEQKLKWLNFGNQYIDEDSIKNVIQLIQQQFAQLQLKNQNVTFFKWNYLQKNASFPQNNSLQNSKHQNTNIDPISTFKPQAGNRSLKSIENNRYSYRENSYSFIVIHKSEAMRSPNEQHPILNSQIKRSTLASKEQIQITNQSFFSLSKQQRQPYDFTLKIQHQKDKNPCSINSIFYITEKQEGQSNDYSIDLIKKQLGLNYHILDQQNLNSDRVLLRCYHTIVELQLTFNQSSYSSERNSIKKPTTIKLSGSNLITFQNFKQTQISLNSVTLKPIDENQTEISSQLNLQHLSKVNIKVYSKRLTILQAALNFINVRLSSYLKNLQPSQKVTQPQSKRSARKTIGSRFTQHLNKRQSLLSIESDMFLDHQNSKGLTNNKISKSSTVLDVPEILLFHILRCDKTYLKDQQKLLTFIDHYYQVNQPQYNDYLLYLSLRPSYLRMTSVLKHYLSQQNKYQISSILNSMIKLKLKIPSNRQFQDVSKLFISKPRITSLKPMKNIKDTVEERQLLVKYMNETSKSSKKTGQKSQQISQQSLFSKKKTSQNERIKKQSSEQIQI